MDAVGTRIASGANLDDYTTPGKYYISSGSDGAGITNCPITNAGSTIWVLRMQTGNRRMQIAMEPVRCLFYIRGRSDTEWGSWNAVTLTTVTALKSESVGADD